MPVEGFICPDEKKIKTADCLKQCRMIRRCCAKAWLESISQDREWRGITASMAGTGIRSIWLSKNYGYYIKPDDRAFSQMSVTGLHTRMSWADFNRLTEEPLKEGTADSLDPDEDKEGFYIITDFKLWGSYKLEKAVGASDIGRELRSETLQLNAYRIGFESKGFPISKMRLQCVARDGGTWMAKKRGLTKNIYLIELPRLKDNEVKDYYDDMKKRFAEAEANNFAPLCSPDETWNGRRCKSFCEVSEICSSLIKKK